MEGNNTTADTQTVSMAVISLIEFCMLLKSEIYIFLIVLFVQRNPGI